MNAKNSASSYSRMVVIPQSEYESLLKNKSSGASVRQLTNIDVAKGGKVTVRNDDNIKNYSQSLPAADPQNKLNNIHVEDTERPEYAETAKQNVLSDDQGNVEIPVQAQQNPQQQQLELPIQTKTVGTQTKEQIEQDENETVAQPIDAPRVGVNAGTQVDELIDFDTDSDSGGQPVLEGLMTRVVDNAKEVESEVINIPTKELKNALEATKTIENKIDAIDDEFEIVDNYMEDDALNDTLTEAVHAAEVDNSDIVALNTIDLDDVIKNNAKSRRAAKTRKLDSVIDRLKKQVDSSKEKRDEYVSKKRDVGKYASLTDKINAQSEKRKRDVEEDEMPGAKRIDDKVHGEDVVSSIVGNLVSNATEQASRRLDNRVRTEVIPSIANDLISAAFERGHAMDLSEPLASEIINEIENPVLENTVENILNQATEAGADIVEIKTSDLEQKVIESKKNKKKIDRVIDKIKINSKKGKKNKKKAPKNDQTITEDVAATLATKAHDRGEELSVVSPIVAEVISEADNPLLENTFTDIIDQARNNNATFVEVKASDLKASLEKKRQNREKLERALDNIARLKTRVSEYEVKKKAGESAKKRTIEESDEEIFEPPNDGMAAKKARKKAGQRGQNLTPNLEELLNREHSAEDVARPIVSDLVNKIDFSKSDSNKLVKPIITKLLDSVNSRSDARKIVSPIVSELLSHVNYIPRVTHTRNEDTYTDEFKKKVSQYDLATKPKNYSAYTNPKGVDIFKNPPKTVITPPTPPPITSNTSLGYDYPTLTAADVTQSNKFPYQPIKKRPFPSQDTRVNKVLKRMDEDMDTTIPSPKVTTVNQNIMDHPRRNVGNKMSAKALVKGRIPPKVTRVQLSRDVAFNKNRPISKEGKKLIVKYPTDTELMKNITIRNPPPPSFTKKQLNEQSMSKQEAMKGPTTAPKKTKLDKAMDKLVSVEKARGKRSQPTPASALKERLSKPSKKKVDKTLPTPPSRRSSRNVPKKNYAEDDYDMW